MATNKNYKKNTVIFMVLLVYAGLIGAMMVWLFKDSNAEGDISKIDSPAVIVVAIVISILTFTVASVVFSAIGKWKDNQALGMPEGSIRALIALSLITLFFILATQIYLRSSQGTVGSLQSVSEEQLKDIPIKDLLLKTRADSLPVYDSTKKTILRYQHFFDVAYRLPANPEASDMAKTIVASFISLIAAISGFYFGSAATKAGVDSSKTDKNPPPSTSINPKSPIPPVGKVGTAMTFEWDVSPQGQPITVELTGDTAKPVADVSNPLKYTYTPATVGKVTLKASLTNFPTIVSSNSIDISA